MNYLAHVYLSCSTEKLLVGNLIADFLKNKDLIGMDDELLKGIELHRAIDSFTDNHKIFKTSTQKLFKRHHKYAPVLTDILYDYLLIKNWDSYSGESLSDFTANAYELLKKNMPLIPSRVSERLVRMIDDNFLMILSSKEGLQKSLDYMDRRTKFPSKFNEAILDLDEHYDLLNAEFNSFFPELIAFVDEHCNCD